MLAIDLVEVDDVAQSLRTGGERYLRRVYDERERRDCGRDPRRLAARFAAKEAMIKVLAPADHELPWLSIGVRVSAGGAPTLELTGAAATLARRRGIRGWALSMAHTRHAAAAVVLAELEDPDR